MSHPGAMCVLCLASRDGAAPPGLLILGVSAFPPPTPEGEREGGLGRAEPGPVLGRCCLEADSAPTEGKDFPGMGRAAPGKVLWALVRFGIQGRRAPCMLQRHLGLGSSVTAEGRSSHCYQPLLRTDF